MAYGDFSRIGTNLNALQALKAFNNINDRLAVVQNRLSTGKRIVRAQDDAAGYHIARGLDSRVRGLQQAFDNVGTAKNVLSVAESGYEAQMSLLLGIKDKVSQAADGALNDDQRNAIQNQIDAMLNEIDDIASSSTWQGTGLNDGNGNDVSLTFHVGDESTNNFTVSLTGFDSATIGTIDVTDSSNALTAISSVESMINTLADNIQSVGNYQIRLNSKEEMLSDSIMNAEAARSRIEDADFAKEQMDALKLQILQQTSMTSFTQANSQPQLVLSLFR